MEAEIPEEFLQICHEISSAGKTREEWARSESSDMFQSDHFCGGYDADEMAFCFSFFDDVRTEYWFQVSLKQVFEICRQERKTISLRRADA